MDDLVSDFVGEATEALGGLQAGLARLARTPSDAEARPEMLRRLHALKGLCGFMGFTRAEAIAHAGEDLFCAYASKPIPSSALADLGRMIERLGALLVSAAQERAEPEGEDSELICALEARPSARSSGPRTRGAATITVPAGDDVPSERRTRAPWAGLDTLAQALGDRLGKRIELVVGGDDLRIEAKAASRLRTALIALVRNACDHAVESPAERRAGGKPTRSILRLSVHRAPDGAAIELADDGRGVDPERIRAHCIAAGRLSADVAAGLDETALQALIFDPGVSTAGAVTALSGRGLGLELVKTELAAIGGTVSLTSVPGRGARFVLSLPAAAVASPAARGRAAA